jgi:hypothetical protein
MGDYLFAWDLLKDESIEYLVEIDQYHRPAVSKDIFMRSTVFLSFSRSPRCYLSQNLQYGDNT